MPRYPGRFAILLPLLLPACAGSGVQNATGILNDRLQARLAPQIAANQIALTPQPDGATVTLLRPPPPPGKDLDDADRLVLSSTIEALLDPSLIQVQIADTAVPPGTVDQPRMRTATAYFRTYNINASPFATTPAATSQGLTIGISVHCPPSHDFWNWRYDERYPTCG